MAKRKRANSAADEVAAGYKPPVCAGKSRAWGAKFRDEEHIAYKPHLPCWHCGADLGCVRCSGPTYELMCKDCQDWGHQDALARHGALAKTPEERAERLQRLREIIGCLS